MAIRPLHDRVLVRRDEEANKSAGGIIITNAEKPICGKIVAVGKGKITKSGERQPLEVKVGDRVYFGKYAGTELTVGNEELLMMREEDL